MNKAIFTLHVVLFSLTASAQTNNRLYLYSHDASGNIISRIKTSLSNAKVVSIKTDTTEIIPHDNRATIKTDATWSEVQITLEGEVFPSDRLSIYTSEGLYVASFPIQSNKVSLNLSALPRGTYLFRFNRDRKLIESKIFKQ